MIPMRGMIAGGVSYISFLLSGLLPWMAIGEGLMRGMTSIVENAPMVRRLPLRSELLIVVPNVSAILFETVALTLFAVVITLSSGFPRMVWLLPFALALQLAFQIAISLLLAASYVFFRDLAQILGFILSVLFYLSPILYQPSGRFARFFAWNPLTPLLGLFRSALLGTPLPDVPSIVFLLAATATLGIASMLFFRRVQPALVDLV
jgi:lipopolysaccharide transport system permease protein